jgi:hypothetical protein
MRAAAALALLLAGASAAHAQTSAKPDRICVPAALLNRLVESVATQPWNQAAPTMDAVREFARQPQVPCTPPAPPPEPPK